MSSSVVLIVNPASGSFSDRKLKVSLEVLRAEFDDILLFYTDKRGDAEAIAREAVKKASRMILAVGGDGTFNEVVNGTAFTDVPVALIPAGTTNVLARELGLPSDIREAAARVIRGRSEYVSLGSISCGGADPSPPRYFVLMAGIGFDAEAVRRLSKPLKPLLGKGAYVLSGLGCLAGYHPERLGMVIDGMTYGGYGLIVCNSRYYAGRFRVCPEASLRSPSLYVAVLEGGRRRDLLRFVSRVLSNTYSASPGGSCMRAERVEVSAGADVQVDGDYIGRTPAVIRSHEKALRLVV